MEENSKQFTMAFAPSGNTSAPIKAEVKGPWVLLHGIGTNAAVLAVLHRCTTIIIKKKEDPKDPTSKDISIPVEMARFHGEDSYRIPVTMLKKVAAALNIQIIPPQKKSNGMAMQALPCLAAFYKMQTRQGPLQASPSQMGIINDLIKLDETDEGAYIKAAMGGGKTMISGFLLLSNPALRPAVLAGKSQADTKQLNVWLKEVLNLNPDFNTPENQIIMWAAGTTPNKKQQELIKEGKGIIIMTHRGMHNMPKTTKLLILDEAHAASTITTMSEIMDNGENIRRMYALSGTPDMRNDRGERMIQAFTGPVKIVKNHEDFEREGRVAPVHIHLHHFHPKERYAHHIGKNGSEPGWGHSNHNRLVERHCGRHRFVTDVTLSLPPGETRVIYTPTAGHANAIAHELNLELQNLLIGGKIDPMDALALMPLVIHAEGTGRKNKESTKKEEMVPKISKKSMQCIVENLKAGKIRCTIVTDFLAVGIDTDKFDHIIDASGQMAKAMSLQRSGRSVRPREGKLAHYHIIVDNHNEALFYPQREKVRTVMMYYGVIADQPITGMLTQRGISTHREGKVETFLKTNLAQVCPVPNEEFIAGGTLRQLAHEPGKDMWGGIFSTPAGHTTTPPLPSIDQSQA